MQFEFECLCSWDTIEQRPAVRGCGCGKENPVMNDYKQLAREGVCGHGIMKRDTSSALCPWEKWM